MRRSLLEAVPEMELAAKLLDAAADALMIDKIEVASRLIVFADMKAIMERGVRMVGKLSLEVHRQVRRPLALPCEQRHELRMPGEVTEEQVFNRDGWHCRFCSCKVIARPARNKLTLKFPVETHWETKEFLRHSALYTMAASLDHVIPHSRGGTNELCNLVTACYCCQFGRGEWTLAESELFDPRAYEPLHDGWDGLTRLNSK